MEAKKQPLASESSVHAHRFALFLLAVAFATPPVFAGGPKYIAGTAYFNPAVVGQPVQGFTVVIGRYVVTGTLVNTLR